LAERLQLMEPRDIVTPSATILGLILTALGILVAIPEANQTTVRNFAFLFIVVVLLFVSAVIFTALTSLLRRAELWSWALTLYIAGWAVIGTILTVLLIGYAGGIDILQSPLPQFSPAVVLMIAGLVGVIISEAVIRLLSKTVNEYRTKVQKISKKVDVSKKELDEATEELKSESIDLINSLMILRSDIEIELRRLAKLSRTEVTRPFPVRRLVTAFKQKEILSPEIAYAILFVYNFCSRAGVHGEVVSEKDALLVRELGLKTLVSLRKLVSKFEQR